MSHDNFLLVIQDRQVITHFGTESDLEFRGRMHAIKGKMVVLIDLDHPLKRWKFVCKHEVYVASGKKKLSWTTHWFNPTRNPLPDFARTVTLLLS